MKTLLLFLLFPVSLLATEIAVNITEPQPRSNYPVQTVTVEAASEDGLSYVVVWVYDLDKQAWFSPIYTRTENLPQTLRHRYTVDLPSRAWIYAEAVDAYGQGEGVSIYRED
jgi:hypothetical protein